jgi:AraC-like DNA-binding protein
MALIRGSSLTGFNELVAELGHDPESILRRSGIRPQDVGDHDAFLPYRALAVVLEDAALMTDALDFGRQLALRQGIEILGPVGVAARTAPTVGEALRISRVYLAAYSPAIEVRLRPGERADRKLFEFAIVEQDMPSCPQLFELSLGVLLQVLRHLSGVTVNPTTTLIPHSALLEEASYRGYYGSEVRFSQPRGGLEVRDADLARPVADDAQAHEVLVRYLEGLAIPDDRGFADSVRRLVVELLPTGTVTMNLLAKQFALHPKTFQRRLSAEGTTFGTLVEQARRELADHYLRATDLALTQIARELGYAEQSVLSRSCRRWFGQPPAALRMGRGGA